MTFRNFARQVNKWYKLFRLQEWELILLPSKGDTVDCNGKAAHAMICPDRNTMTATIEVAMGTKGKDLKWVALHEMLHLALQELTDAEETILGSLGAGERRLADALLAEKREETVLKLQRAFMELQKG